MTAHRNQHPNVAVRPHGGVPTLFINDIPSNGLMVSPPVNHPYPVMARFRRVGIRIYAIHPVLTQAFAEEMLAQDPEGWFLPRFAVMTPPGWLAKHRCEAMRRSDGSAMPEASWVSRAWRKAAATETARAVRWWEDSPLGPRTIGYHIGHGVAGEWIHPSQYELLLADYSAPERKAFGADIPELARRMGDGMNAFFDPKRDADVIAYQRYRAHAAADTFNFFAGVVKRACNRRKLVGGFFGYILGLSWMRKALIDSGHLGLGAVLGNPDVDFIAAVSTYAQRGPGVGTTVHPLPLCSVQLAGKLALIEHDYRTHSGQGGTWSEGFGFTRTATQTRQVQRRAMAATLAAGNAQWWFDMTGRWYTDPRLLRDIAGLATHQPADQSSGAEIAFVIDPDSMCALQPGIELPWAFLEGQDLELSRLGAPVDRLLADDLPRAGRYKLVIFANAWDPSAKRRAQMERLKRDGRTLLWLYMDAGASGIRIKQTGGHALLRARTPQGERFGSDARVAPFFYVDDARARTLAISEDHGHPVMAVRRMRHWTSAYCAAGPVSGPVLRRLARAAGVHIWWSGEGAFCANRTFCAITPQVSGPQRLSPPPGAHLLDCDSGRRCTSGTMPMRGQDTRLFRVICRQSRSV